MTDKVATKLKKQTLIFGFLTVIMVLSCGITLGMMAVMFDLGIKFNNTVHTMCILSTIVCMVTVLYGHNCLLYINSLKSNEVGTEINNCDVEDVPLSDLENISESIK